MKKHLLFVCSYGQARSVCASDLFKNNPKYESKFCGVMPDADISASQASIVWADIIFCMEEKHKILLLSAYPKYNHKEIHVLNIPASAVSTISVLRSTLQEKLHKFLL